MNYPSSPEHVQGCSASRATRMRRTPALHAPRQGWVLQSSWKEAHGLGSTSKGSLLLRSFHRIPPALPTWRPHRLLLRHQEASWPSPETPREKAPSALQQPGPAFLASLRKAASAHARLPELSARSRTPRIPVLIRVSESLGQWWPLTAPEGGAKSCLTRGLWSPWALSGNGDSSAEEKDRGRESSVWARVDGFEMERLPSKN